MSSFCDEIATEYKMLSKAHIAVGMAAAFTVTGPETIPEALPVIAGGALGCLVCDIDCETKAEKKDSSRWRIVMLIVAIAALIEDDLIGGGMWASLEERGGYMWFIGLAGFMLTCTFAGISKHRGFSHSLPALALMTGFAWLVFPQTALPFAAAFISHLALDITNYRPVMLFWPAKTGVKLGWFHADGLANRLTALAGTVWLAAAILILIR